MKAEWERRRSGNREVITVTGQATRLGIGIGMAVLSQAALVLASRFLTPSWWDYRLFVLAFGASFTLYLAAVAMLVRCGAPDTWAAAAVLALAIPLRLFLALNPPVTSGDIWRYVWDGRVMAHGVNPYQFAPSDPALASLRDDHVYPRVGLPDLRTIYPPLAEAFFGVAYAFTPDRVIGLKLGLVLGELAAAWWLIPLLRQARRSPAWLAAYAWHPLLMVEVAQAGHVDGLALPLVVLALRAALRRRHGWAGAFLGAAALVKFYPAVLLPALWQRRDWRLPVAFAAVTAAGYLAAAGPGGVWLRNGAVFGSLSQVVSTTRFNPGFLWGGVQRLTGWLEANPDIAATAALMLLLLAVAGWVAWLAPRPGDNPAVELAQRATVMAGSFLLVSRMVHPWYLTFALPLLTLWPARWLWLFSATVMASYLTYHTNPWHLPFGVRVAEYLPVYLLLLYGGLVALRPAWLPRVLRPRSPSGRPPQEPAPTGPGAGP